jgi:Ca-activated chloride channel homolog
MVSVSFVQPFYLFFLFLIPILIFLHVVTLKMARSRALRFANFEAIGRIKGIDFFSKNLVILVINVLVIFLVAMGLAGLKLHTELDASVHSFIIAVDNSKSMEADDFLPNRLEAAKDAAIGFVGATPVATRIGVISFSGNSFIEQDVSDSKVLVETAIENIVLSDIGGTDLSEAMITSTNLLRSEDSRAVILISDGQINVGEVGDIIDYANENLVLIHTIAIGTDEGGQTSYGLSKLDEDSLSALAYNTGGKYFRASSVEELEKSFVDAITLTNKKVGIPVGSYALMAALVLFVLSYFLMNTRFRRLP